MFLKAALKLTLLFILQISPTLANDCGTPPDLENGNYNVSTGKQLYYTCNEGYILIGRKWIICTNDGWTKLSSHCEKDCSAPPRISNGEVTYESTAKGSSAKYACYPGYQLIGRPLLLCADSGWNGKAPHCTGKSCGSPGEILNGWYNATGNTFGAKVTFYCDEGYQIIGKDYRLCETDGWSGDVPGCQPVTCPDLPSIENGFAPTPPNSDFWESGSVAKYSCIGDYSLIGARSLICSHSGAWSDDPPKCRDVQCFVPDAPTNGHIRSGPRNVLKYGEEVLFECDYGFEIVGTNPIKCNENSRFSDDPPTCRLNGCRKPQAIAYRRIVNQKEIYARYETVTFTCRIGYKLIGNESIRCMGYNEYDQHEPECREIRCQVPSIQNGGYAPELYFFQSDSYPYGKVIRFTCNKGFKPEGVSESRCGDNGIFEPDPPTCKRVHCEKPRNLNNVIIQPYRSIYNYRDHVTFSCRPGYILKGSTESVCEGSGTFDPPPPTCMEVHCEQPRNLNNVIIQPDRFIYNYRDQVTFSCHPGYILKGSTESVCEGRGTFDPPPPTCTEDDSEWTISKSAHGNIKSIIKWSREIINEKKDIIKMEQQLLQKEENILLKYQAIVRNLEIFLNRTNIPKAV